jgi:tetratricopeptide (TPR) repeat protein
MDNESVREVHDNLDNESITTEENNNYNYDNSMIGLYELAALYRKQALKYEKKGRIKLMINKYLLAIELGDAYAMNNLAIYYENNRYPESFIRKYYEMAIQYSFNCDAMYNYADYFKAKNDHINMEKYFKMAADVYNDIESMIQLGVYYGSINKTEQEEHYMKLAFGQIKIPHDYKLLFRNIYNYESGDSEITETEIEKMDLKECTRLFKFDTAELINIVNFCNKYDITASDNIVLRCIMKIYHNNEHINIYINKVALFKRLNNIIECGICYEDVLNIDLKCGHCVCTKCYIKLINQKCPFCRL